MLLSDLNIAWIFSDYVFPLFLFVMGLGLVVFVHELGHFLAAKGVGIKVERFAFGFGKRLLGFKIGDTDYCINLLPLGGYVKMLGQEDIKPLTENAAPDPRSYEAKSVGARFLVISAGVIMNIILAGVLFVVVGLVGRDMPSPIVGGTVSGSPIFNATITWDTPLSAGVAALNKATSDGHGLPTTAPSAKLPAVVSVPPAATALASLTTSMPTTATAKLPPLALSPLPYDPWVKRLQTGDKVLSMEGDSFVVKSDGLTSFFDIAMVAALAGPTDKYTFIIERTVDGVTRRGRVTSGVYSNGGMFAFGIQPPVGMTVGEPEDGSVSMKPFQTGDTLVAINGHRVENQGEVDRLEKQYTGAPVNVTVLRKSKEETFTVIPTLSNGSNVVFKKDGTPVAFTQASPKDDSVEYTQADGKTLTLSDKDLDREALTILGMSPRLQVINVQERSNAEKAGVQPGDVILNYGDRFLPTFSQLLEINKEHAGQTVKMDVLRDGKTQTLEVKPKQRTEGVQIGLMSVGDLSSPVVAEVLPGSVADKLGVAKGATIQAINGHPVATWIDIYQSLAASQGRAVDIKFLTRGGQEKTAKIDKLMPEMFSRNYYEFSTFGHTVMFKPLTFMMKQPGVGAALAWGGKETVRMTLMSYASLRSLIAGWASVRHMTGPIGIGAMAVKAGQHGIMEFINFLAFISSAIAVFNFLPLPVLDGGHALFLLIEKVRGKPVPVKVLNYAQYAGLFLLLGIFLAVTYQDIARLVGNWFW